jgi:hypothetical protein
MALAMMYPETRPGKKRDGKTSSEIEKVSVGRLSHARAVLRHSRALAEEVLKGNGVGLDEALQQVRAEEA